MGEVRFKERCRDLDVRAIKAKSLNITKSSDIQALKIDADDRAKATVGDLTSIVYLFLILHIIDFIIVALAG